MTHSACVYVDSALTVTQWFGHTALHGRLLWQEKRRGQRARGEGIVWEEEKGGWWEEAVVRVRGEMSGLEHQRKLPASRSDSSLSFTHGRVQR